VAASDASNMLASATMAARTAAERRANGERRGDAVVTRGLLAAAARSAFAPMIAEDGLTGSVFRLVSTLATTATMMLGMRIHEFQARKLPAEYVVAVPASRVAGTPEEARGAAEELR